MAQLGLDQQLLDELTLGMVPDEPELPVLLAISDNGPQMTSKHTAAFMAARRAKLTAARQARIATRRQPRKDHS